MRVGDYSAVTTTCSHHTEAQTEKPQRDFPGRDPLLNISHLSLQYQQETPTLESIFKQPEHIMTVQVSTYSVRVQNHISS